MDWQESAKYMNYKKELFLNELDFNSLMTWCDNNKIELTKAQLVLATHILNHPIIKTFQVAGSGLSFLLKNLDNFIKSVMIEGYKINE